MTGPLAEAYDVVIVGSGFGGGAVAHALSHRGIRTLLVERGMWSARDDEDWNGQSILLAGRYRSESPVAIAQYGKAAKDTTPNAVVGGNSIFFGGASLRLRELDFATWPITYAELEPWYARAEALLEVHGTAGEDPTGPPRSTPYPATPPPFSEPALRIYEGAKAAGFHPFHVPTAIDYSGRRGDACIRCNTCDGFPCKVSAKNDVAVTMLARADAAHLTIVAGATASRVLHAHGRATGVEVIDRATGQRHEVTARTVVVAAGAMHTPALLLRSGLQEHDRSQLLGKNLMRHCNAMMGYVFPFQTNPQAVNHKQICISDLYEQERATTQRAVGVIQDMMMPPPEVVRVMAPGGFRWLAYKFAARIQTLICIAEDEPQVTNFVSLSSDRVDALGLPVTTIAHAYSAADLHRRDLLVGAARKVMRAAGGMIGKVRLVDSFSHAVGTTRFGTDAATSVLDVDCALHGVPNVFVTDGSVMPTSGGVNPSLTITANALRVSERIVARL